MTNDRLNDHSRKGGSDPKQGKMSHIGTEGLEDAAYIGILQSEAELNTKKTESHVPDIPERHSCLLHHTRNQVINFLKLAFLPNNI
jgi:hypothetical protein